MLTARVTRRATASLAQHIRTTSTTHHTKHKTPRRQISRSHRLPVVATSEFWWEDEQEFDALTEVLLPKQVVVCTPDACQQQLDQLRPRTFAAAFSSPAVKPEAEQLWQELGRAGPPLFLKVRTREALQQLEQEGVEAAAAGEQFWQELLGQSWRMDLDYGLNKQATLQAMTEQLLVLVESSSGLRQLVNAALSEPAGSSSSSEGLTVLSFSGWNQGTQQQQLKSWRQLEARTTALSSGATA